MSQSLPLPLPNSLRVTRAIGWTTFIEVIRDKVLYNILVCSILLFGAGILASRLTFIHPERVILDFGLSGIGLSNSAIAIFTGAGLLGKEFERRTIYVILCHPITRFQFICGKFFGIATVLFLNWILISTAYLLILLSVSPQGFEIVSSTLFVALVLLLFQSLILASISILISTFSTTSLSAIITIGFYLLGNSISYIRFIAAKTVHPVVKLLLNCISMMIPNLEYFNLGSKATYGLPVPMNYVGLSILYSVFMVLVILLISGMLLQRREV